MRARYIIVVLCFVFTFNVAGQDKKSLESIKTVKYCDLISNPVQYDKQTVRVTANYFVGFEVSVMNSPDCKRTDTWVEFDPSASSLTKAKIWKSFETLTDAGPLETKDGGTIYQSQQVSVTWIGFFQGVKPQQTIGKDTFSLGFGHTNGYDFQFTVQKIERVEKIE